MAATPSREHSDTSDQGAAVLTSQNYQGSISATGLVRISIRVPRGLQLTELHNLDQVALPCDSVSRLQHHLHRHSDRHISNSSVQHHQHRLLRHQLLRGPGSARRPNCSRTCGGILGFPRDLRDLLFHMGDNYLCVDGPRFWLSRTLGARRTESSTSNLHQVRVSLKGGSGLGQN